MKIIILCGLHTYYVFNYNIFIYFLNFLLFFAYNTIAFHYSMFMIFFSFVLFLTLSLLFPAGSYPMLLMYQCIECDWLANGYIILFGIINSKKNCSDIIIGGLISSNLFLFTHTLISQFIHYTHDTYTYI